MNIVPGTVNLDPDGVNAYGSLRSPPDVRCRQPCTMGVGCEEAGVCYASAHGQPEQCDRTPPSPVPDAVRELPGKLRGEAGRHMADGFKRCGRLLLSVAHELESALASQQTSSSVSDPKWSPTPPTKDGWYWMRHADCVGCTIVEVAEGRVFENGDEWLCKPEVDSQFWHGPLQEPTE